MTVRQLPDKGIKSPKRLARIAGLLYLLNGILSGFALGYVFPKMYVAGNATKSADNLLANTGLVKTAIIADLLQATIWVLLALTLYHLLKHVNKTASIAMVVLVSIGAGITLLAAVFQIEALRI